MKTLKCLLLLLVLISLSFSHSILLMVDIESDSTIYIEGGLSTGRVPAGATITITEKASGRPIWEGAMPDSGNITLPLPEKPYTVSLNLSEGHSVTKSGPLKPKKSEPEVTKDEKVKDSEQVTHSGSTTKIITISFLILAVLIGFLFGFKRKR